MKQSFQFSSSMKQFSLILSFLVFATLLPNQIVAQYAIQNNDYFVDAETNKTAEAATPTEAAPSKKQFVSISPSATMGYVSVEADDELLDKAKLFDPNGENISDQITISKEGKGLLHIDISKLPKGAYILQMGTKASLLEKQ